MFEPVRGGTRGGQAEFKWSDVAADKDREHYLGHSINAPTGRWQKNKDVHWYNRERKQTDSQRREEIQKVKALEADALAVALGFEPASKSTVQAKDESNGQDANSVIAEEEKKREERKRRKAEKKVQKRAKREARRLLESKYESDEEHNRQHKRSRSKSPHRQEHGRSRRSRRRSLSPPSRR
ncbi:hypothetical protein AX15_001464 [Amanita polypyramis BW_CC]|nr:hypothetical protein AX15_001464 [Amanita polypyramis BW_CC]